MPLVAMRASVSEVLPWSYPLHQDIYTSRDGKPTTYDVSKYADLLNQLMTCT